MWRVVAGPDATTATVPLAPSSANEAQFLGSTSVMRVHGGTIGTGTREQR